MRATHRWFGSDARPLSGWVHLPDRARTSGVVVLCAPLGHEAANALWALQSVADRLAHAGAIALRFDYTGTGDSAGALDDPGRLPEWLSDIETAVSFGASMGPGPVVLAGMRMGALLAAEAAATGTPVDGLVQWDPYPSGRAFFRVEQTLLATGYGAGQPADGSVAGPAFRYGAETVGALAKLRLEPHDPPAPPTLVLARAGDRMVAAAREPFEASGATWEEVPGQAELLDVPPDMTAMPTEAVERVVGWSLAILDRPAATVHGTFGDDAAVIASDDGSPVREHPVLLGPHSLFGMVAEPATSDATPSTVVFLSAGALDHSGPGRLWVTLARRFAARGIRSVRVDLDGIGETYGRQGRPRNIPKPPEAIDDVCDLAAALGDPEGTDLVLVGLSSGGYHAIEAGLRLHPHAVCAVNPGLATWVPEQDEGKVDPRRRAYRPMPAALRSLAVKHSRVARWTWRALLQVRVWSSPAAPVAGVARRGTPVLMIVNDHDSVQFEPSLYWSLVRRRLRRRGLLLVDEVPGNDHSLYTTAGQDRATAILSDWVVSRYGRAQM